ncbi:Polyadenylate-binding protein-interacting protein 7-like protein [Drosera capensis]
MSLSKSSSPVPETNQSNGGKGTILNPNAAEFVPLSLRVVPPGTASRSDVSSKFLTGSSSGKRLLERSESSISTNSEEETRQYWQRQLPDDLIPDFNVSVGVGSGLGGLSLAGLSLHDSSAANRLSAVMDNGYLLKQQLDLSPHHANGTHMADNARYPRSSFGDNPSRTYFTDRPIKPWDKQASNSDHLQAHDDLEENFVHGYPNDVVDDIPTLENSSMNPVEFLASQFPGFAVYSLAEVYFANGCDLHLTMEMLAQLELQVDGGLNLNPTSKSSSTPNVSPRDFPALSPNKASLSNYAGRDVPHTANHRGSSDKENMLLFKSGPSLPSRGSVDFASAVRKLASPDCNVWKFDQNGSADGFVGSSNVLTSSYNDSAARSVYVEKYQGRGSARAAPVWLETGEAVGNLYSELREEARDHARIRNAYFEQARQAYLIGNKALAKELSVKGQLHNMHMKAAHQKAQESIYQQSISERQSHGKGQEKMIDLHGLHTNEAIHVLKHELAELRSAARSAGQRLPVYICVGTGRHTRGSRTPARLPIGVQRYLLEDEGLDYSEPQPGLLRVVIY